MKMTKKLDFVGLFSSNDNGKLSQIFEINKTIDMTEKPKLPKEKK